MKKILVPFLLLFINTFFAQTPAPPAMGGIYAIDYDGDGIATFDLNYLINIVLKSSASNVSCDVGTYSYNVSGYNFVLHKQSDNSIIPNTFFETSTIDTYLKTIYIGGGPQYPYFHCYFPSGFDWLEVIPTTNDFDKDIVLTINEDLNGNKNLYDDDTDLDGQPNFQDSDDDGDGVKTKDEDYNKNGNPQDDDINSNNIPDYLDKDAYLSVITHELENIAIYPIPSKDSFKIQLPNNLSNKVSISIINILGEIVLQKNTHDNETTIHHNLEAGVYLLKIEINNSFISKKLIIE